MDAVKFLQERERMFLNGDSSLIYWMEDGVDPEILVRNVEEWSAAHPRKTRQEVLLEQWPNAARDRGGVMNVCPRLLDVDISCADAKTGLCRTCDDCRKEFWMQEVE